MKKPNERPIFVRAAKALVRVTLSDSFRSRVPAMVKKPHDIQKPSCTPSVIYNKILISDLVEYYYACHIDRVY